MQSGSAGLPAIPQIVPLASFGRRRVSQVSPNVVERRTWPFSPVVIWPHPAYSTLGSSALTSIPRAYGSGHLSRMPMARQESPSFSLTKNSLAVLA